MTARVSKFQCLPAVPLTFQVCGTQQESAKPNTVVQIKNKVKGFCCMPHSQMFETGFDSDEEVAPKFNSKRPKVCFLSELPLEAKHYLLVRNKKQDIGCQCDPDQSGFQSLSDLADQGVILSDNTAGVLHTRPYYVTHHIPEFTKEDLPPQAFWSQYPDVALGDSRPVECPHCNQRFASGQALGGHTSRRHSSKKLTHKRRPRQPRDEDEFYDSELATNNGD